MPLLSSRLKRRRSWPQTVIRFVNDPYNFILVVIVLVLLTIAAVFSIAFSYIVYSKGYDTALHHVCQEDVSCKTYVKTLLIALTVALVALPILWFTTLRIVLQFKRKHTSSDANAIKVQELSELFSSLTTILVPFFILGLALLLEAPKIMEHPSSVEAVGAITAIMILYALTLLGGFVFDQLYRSRKEIEDTVRRLEDSSSWLKIQEALSYSKGHYTPAPASSTLAMLKSWAKLYDQGTVDAAVGSSKETDLALRLRDACVSTLLETYAVEEKSGIAGSLGAERVPARVWPAELLNDPSAAAFLSTHVGYYSTYLREVIGRLEKVRASTSGFVPCTAIVTYVHPMQWWNWPSEEPNIDAIYDPVLQYLTALQDFATSGGKIFRRIPLKKTKGKGNPKLMAVDQILVQGLKNNTLRFLRDVKADQLVRTGPKNEDWPGVTGHSLSDDQRDKVLNSLSHAASGSSKSSVYWVLDVKESDGPCLCRKNAGGERPHRNWECLPTVEEVYSSVMHPNGGMTEFITVNDEFSDNKMLVSFEQDGPIPGLHGCLDIVFLGVCGSEVDNVWNEAPDKCRWGCALLATMGPNSVTMFLTVIHKQQAVNRLWEAVQASFAPYRGETPYMTWGTAAKRADHSRTLSSAESANRSA